MSGLGSSTLAKGLYSDLSAPRIALVVLKAVQWIVPGVIILNSTGIFDVVGFLESGGGKICHHISSRCFFHDGVPWSVCARCSGMYAGWLIIVALGSIAPNSCLGFRSLCWIFLVFVAAVLLVFVERIGLIITTNNLRAVLGLPLGIFPSCLLILATSRLRQTLYSMRIP